MNVRTTLRGLAAAFAAGILALGTGTASAAPAPAADDGEPPAYTATRARTYDAFDARQGIAVDGRFFYAVDNREITKHDKASGEPVLQFAGDEDGPFIHMDSGAVVGGRLYAAHSNYDASPMTGSIEIFDTRTMRHVGTHAFGVHRGSLTWLDRHDGAWWAGFANYDKVPDGGSEPYGGTDNTKIVKMDDDFRELASWTVPKRVLDRFKPMSNSGGSWGPDGRLWLTGHDLGEAYVMNVPDAGAELEWVATVHLPEVEGQGIAWDRSARTPTLWTIKRSTRQAMSFTVPYASIKDPAGAPWKVLGPGEFRR